MKGKTSYILMVILSVSLISNTLFSQAIDSAEIKYMNEYNNTIRSFSIEKVSNQLHLQTLKHIINNPSLLSSDIICITPLFITNDSLILSSGKYKFYISKAKFQPQKYNIETSPSNKVLSIHGDVKLGTRFKLPQEVLNPIYLSVNDKRAYTIKTKHSNLYNPSFATSKNCSDNDIKLFHDTHNNLAYLYIQGGDGGGFYAAIFIFHNQTLLNKIYYTP